MREVEPDERAALYLGTLLHDVGKPLGKGHSEKGARLAVTIAERLRMSDARRRRAPSSWCASTCSSRTSRSGATSTTRR